MCPKHTFIFSQVVQLTNGSVEKPKQFNTNQNNNIILLILQSIVRCLFESSSIYRAVLATTCCGHIHTMPIVALE